MMITVICLIGMLASVNTILLARKASILYVAAVLTMFADVVTVGIRSALTKIVGENDIGTVNYF